MFDRHGERLTRNCWPHIGMHRLSLKIPNFSRWPRTWWAGTATAPRREFVRMRSASTGGMRREPPGAPGPLGLADPDRTTRLLESAGFTEVTLEDLTLSMRIGDDVEDALSFIRSIPFVRDLLAAAPALQQNAAVDAVRTALAPYAGPDGVVTHNNGVWPVTPVADPVQRVNLRRAAVHRSPHAGLLLRPLTSG